MRPGMKVLDMGCGKVFPIYAKAHALPYAEGFFDAVIAIDCYHYFGASESYFPDIFSNL